MENEHDQAMAAYFKACQLMRGCHLPLLYIGLEYSLTNNQQYAERFFSQVSTLTSNPTCTCTCTSTQALEIAPHDPFVLHELGVSAFHSGQHEVAEKFLRSALTKVRPFIFTWSPGHLVTWPPATPLTRWRVSARPPPGWPPSGSRC